VRLLPLFLLASLLPGAGCSAVHRPFNITITPLCNDKLPVRMLIDQACPPDGVCGFTCAPGRWVVAPDCVKH
jgi:hypothetical protein